MNASHALQVLLWYLVSEGALAVNAVVWRVIGSVTCRISPFAALSLFAAIAAGLVAAALLLIGV